MRLLPALLALLAVLSSHHAAGSVDAVPQKLRMPRRALATATPTTSPSPRNYQPFSEQFRYNPQGTARSSHAGPVALDLTIVTLPLSNAAVASAAVTVNGDAFVGTRDGAMMAWGDINGVDKFELRWQFQAGGMSARLLRCCRRIFAYACTLHPTPSPTDAAFSVVAAVLMGCLQRLRVVVTAGILFHPPSCNTSTPLTLSYNTLQW